MTYNSLFELGSHSQGINLERWHLFNENAANTLVVGYAAKGTDATANINTNSLHTTGPEPWLSGAFVRQFGWGVTPDISQFEPADGEFTLFLRIASADGNLIAKSEDFGNRIVIRRLSNTIRFVVAVGGSAINIDGITDVVNDGLFHTIACTRENDTGAGEAVFRIYIDGTLDRTLTTPLPFDLTNSGTWSFGAGADAIGVDYGFFSKALSQSEIDEWIAGPEPVNNTIASAPTGTLQPGETLTGSTDDTWRLPPPFNGLSNGIINRSTVEWWSADDASGTNKVKIAGSEGSNSLVLDQSLIGKHIATLRRGTNDGGFDSNEDTLSAWTANAVESAIRDVIKSTLYINRSNKVNGNITRVQKTNGFITRQNSVESLL